jgi:hypothetical protein
MYPVLVSTLNEESTNWQDTHPGVLLHVGMVQIRLQFDSNENCLSACRLKNEQCPHGVFPSPGPQLEPDMDHSNFPSWRSFAHPDLAIGIRRFIPRCFLHRPTLSLQEWIMAGSGQRYKHMIAEGYQTDLYHPLGHASLASNLEFRPHVWV